MSKGMEQLQNYAALLNHRSLRERVILLLAALILLLVVWNQIVFEPRLALRKKGLQENSNLKSEISLLRSEEQLVVAQSKIDPDLTLRQQIGQLDQAIQLMDQELKAKLVNLLSPREMPLLLQELLHQQKSLHLVKMENLPAEALLGKIEEGQPAVLGIYQHALDMELEGGYLDLLTYLKALEQLQKRVFWDILSIENQEYPSAKIHLRIHTLSLSEDWIGV